MSPPGTFKGRTISGAGPRDSTPSARWGRWCPSLDVDLDRLSVVTRVNGEERQRGGVEQMVFSIPFLISYMSRDHDAGARGPPGHRNPEGVGPLAAGDVVEVEIPGLGTLTNPVVARVGGISHAPGNQ